MVRDGRTNRSPGVKSSNQRLSANRWRSISNSGSGERAIARVLVRRDRVAVWLAQASAQRQMLWIDGLTGHTMGLDTRRARSAAISAVSKFEYRYNVTIKAFPSHAEPVFESESQRDLVWASGGLRQRRRPLAQGAGASPR